MSALETAVSKDNLKRLVIEPVTREKCHGKVTLLVDKENKIQQARFLSPFIEKLFYPKTTA
jgi:NAD-reducing hydrogenase large subunit